MYISKYHLEKARIILIKLLELSSNSMQDPIAKSDALHRKARLLMKQGNFTEAVDVCKECEQLCTKSYAVHVKHLLLLAQIHKV
jgi:hypothetical protein